MQHQETEEENQELLLILKPVKGGNMGKNTSPKDYDRWNGKTGVKVIKKAKTVNQDNY